MVGVDAVEIFDMERYRGVVDEALEEFPNELRVEPADFVRGERAMEREHRSPGEVDHDAGERFVERDVGVAIADDSPFVAQRAGKRLPHRDADIFDRVVVVDVGVSTRFDAEIERAMTGNLVDHVIQEGHAGGDVRFAGAVEIEMNGDARLKGGARHFSGSGSHHVLYRQKIFESP